MPRYQVCHVTHQKVLSSRCPAQTFYRARHATSFTAFHGQPKKMTMAKRSAPDEAEAAFALTALSDILNLRRLSTDLGSVPSQSSEPELQPRTDEAAVPVMDNGRTERAPSPARMGARAPPTVHRPSNERHTLVPLEARQFSGAMPELLARMVRGLAMRSVHIAFDEYAPGTVRVTVREQETPAVFYASILTPDNGGVPDALYTGLISKQPPRQSST